MSVSLLNNLHLGWTQRFSIYFVSFLNLLLPLIISSKRGTAGSFNFPCYSNIGSIFSPNAERREIDEKNYRIFTWINCTTSRLNLSFGKAKARLTKGLLGSHIENQMEFRPLRSLTPSPRFQLQGTGESWREHTEENSVLSSPELCFHDQNHLALSCFALSSKRSRRRKKNICVNYCCIISF